MGEFISPELEDLYRADHAQNNRWRMMLICATTAIAYLAAIAINWLDFGVSTALFAMLGIRSLCFLLGSSAGYLAWRGVYNRAFAVMMITYMCALGVGEATEVVLNLRFACGTVFPMAIILVLMYYLFIPVCAAIAIIPSIFMSIVYVGAIAFLTHSGASYMINLSLFFLLANIYGLVHFVSFSRMHRCEFYGRVEQERLNTELRQEIAVRQVAQANLLKLATLDGLTEVFNRRHFMELLTEEIQRIERHPHPLALIMLDVDHFKAVNDTYGHPAGDAVLKQLAQTIRTQLRTVDHVGRFGGEEFIVLLPNTTRTDAYGVAERIRQIVAQTAVLTRTASLSITISLGISILTRETDTQERLIKAADEALYQAKKTGRNRTIMMPTTEDAIAILSQP